MFVYFVVSKYVHVQKEGIVKPKAWGGKTPKSAWYWVVLINPSTYWAVKAKGGNAAEDADLAIRVLTPWLVFVVVVVAIIAVLLLLFNR